MRTAARIITVVALAAGTGIAAAPAQAAFNCVQRDLPNGWYNLCSGVARPHQYQTQVTCGRAWAPQQRYLAKGEWRYYGTGNPSVATCYSGDFLTGERQLNFN
ncbi:hypothetical protein [Knoellia sp. LjRoot47]|uniref:hypothetical protein n=1 Tax=Knoellia sp. LjRoot47 TaxID=3342330 RepID=UPI003ED0C2CD